MWRQLTRQRHWYVMLRLLRVHGGQVDSRGRGRRRWRCQHHADTFVGDAAATCRSLWRHHSQRRCCCHTLSSRKPECQTARDTLSCPPGRSPTERHSAALRRWQSTRRRRQEVASVSRAASISSVCSSFGHLVCLSPPASACDVPPAAAAAAAELHWLVHTRRPARGHRLAAAAAMGRPLRLVRCWSTTRVWRLLLTWSVDAATALARQRRHVVTTDCACLAASVNIARTAGGCTLRYHAPALLHWDERQWTGDAETQTIIRRRWRDGQHGSTRSKSKLRRRAAVAACQ